MGYIKDIIYRIKNLIKFFKVVWNYSSFDYIPSLALFQKGLIELEKESNKNIWPSISKSNLKDLQNVISLLDDKIYNPMLPIATKFEIHIRDSKIWDLIKGTEANKGINTWYIVKRSESMRKL